MKKKKVEEFVPKATNVIIYDDKNIMYYQGAFTYFEQNANVDSGMYMNGKIYHNIMSWSIRLDVPNLEKFDNIILDETTMKRIAKYNKQQECKRLDKEIKEKQGRIKELDNLLQDKEKRWNKVKEYIKNIYEINLYEDDDDYYDYDD